MSVCRNCITVYNSGDKEIPAFTPVAIGKRLDGSGLSDDFCFEASIAGKESKIIGVTDSRIYPKMPGRAIISGVATARLAAFFDQGDVLAPNDTGAWQVSENGQVTVISPADKKGFGTVLLAPAKTLSSGYQGYFCVSDVSRDGKHIIRISGGNTDLGWVEDAELDITETCSQIIDGGMLSLYLVAQYINGGYTLHFSADIDYDENITEQYFGNWLIASIYLTDEGKLGIIQQWQNGAIYFGERYWVK